MACGVRVATGARADHLQPTDCSMDFSSCLSALRTLRHRYMDEVSVLESIDGLINCVSSKQMDQLEAPMLHLLDHSKWDLMAVGFVVGTEYLSSLSSKSTTHMLDLALKHFEHKEPRLRTLIARFFGAIVAREGLTR